MAWWKQLALSMAVAVAALVAWIAWMPEARPMLERAGVWSVLEGSGALNALAAIGINPAEPARPGGGAPPWMGGGTPGVIAAEVVEVTRNTTVTAIGTGQALRSVAVTPEAPGRLTEIMVQPGQRVAAGDLLARLDAAAERIALDRAELALDEARDTAARLQRLAGTATEVQIRDAERAVRSAELALAQAELDLSRRDITAPIDGVVGFVPANVGNQVTTGSEITRIDDRSVLLVEFLVPERHVLDVTQGTPVLAQPLGRFGTQLEGQVRNVDSRVQVDSRSLTVEAELANPDDALRAGMAFSISVPLPGEQLPAVDALAVQWGRQGAFVWAIRDGRSERVPIRIMQRKGGLVLVQGALRPGDLVVREGVQTLRDGGEVDVRDTVRPSTDAEAELPLGVAAPEVTLSEG
ncbi:MAG: efflux RND transporter periplasmic adaptor subunit [Alkalilacustris sp.]